MGWSYRWIADTVEIPLIDTVHVHSLKDSVPVDHSRRGKQKSEVSHCQEKQREEGGG